jgi:quercetin dioxygenase-like cupin family protein
MAIKGKVISNTKTKQSIKFIHTGKDTNGQLLEMESVYLANSQEPAPHYHPIQEEDFQVLQGELTVTIKDRLMVLKEGDTLHIPPGTSHAMWNNSNLITVINWQVRPALNTEHLLETISGLANDGKTNEQGRPGILQVAATANHFANVFRLSNPPYIVQKVLFSILAPVAYLLGYRATYRKYID